MKTTTTEQEELLRDIKDASEKFDSLTSTLLDIADGYEDLVNITPETDYMRTLSDLIYTAKDKLDKMYEKVDDLDFTLVDEDHEDKNENLALKRGE